MPFGEYENFDDCLSKNSDKNDPSAYCGYIKNKVEEARAIKEAKIAIAKEQEPEQVASLTTPDAGNIETEEPKDLTSPQGSSKEAGNPHVDTQPPQDQAQPTNNSEPDQARPLELTPENGEKVEYEGETYVKVKALEYNGKIYIPKCSQCPKQARENDLDYEDVLYEPADEDVLELDDDFYVKDEEQAPTVGDIPVSDATTAIDIPELNPISESIIIKESNGRYRKYNIFQANEQEEVPVEKPADVEETPVIEIPSGNAPTTEEPEVEPVEQKPEPASEEVKAVEKIIVKENGKLKFKSVFTEVKKKLRNKTK
jgi:hypothetical protein